MSDPQSSREATRPAPIVTVAESARPRERSRTLGDFVFGRRLASAEEEEHKIGPLTGIPVLGLDAVSSAAYGPEAALTLLLPLGALGVSYVVPIMAIVVIVSKFTEGAWIAVIAVPLLVLTFWRINRHYGAVAMQVADDQPLAVTATPPPIVIVPVQSWNKLTSRGLRFALGFSPDVRALHILTTDSTICELTAVWEELAAGPARAAGLPPPQLVLRKSTFRQFFAPLVEYIEQLRDGHPDRDIVVIVPDLVVRHWYHAFLHNNRGTLLRGLLRLRGGHRVIVVSMPFYLKDRF